MTTLILLFFFLNFFGTLPFSARIVGVRTKMLALSFSLFNIIALFTRTANGFQTPFLAKYIETNLLQNNLWSPIPFFRELLFVSTIGCLFGMLFIPSTQRIFTIGVQRYYEDKSILRLVFKAFSKNGLKQIGASFKVPSIHKFKQNLSLKGLPIPLFIYHCIATAFITVGIISTLYAGVLHPEYRTTASSLSFIINGIAVIILFIFIDPPLSIMTEDAVQGKIPEHQFRRCIIWFVISRIMGTILAQLLLIPLAKLTTILVPYI